MPKLKKKKNIKKTEVYKMVIFMVATILIIGISYLAYLKSNNAISSDLSFTGLLKKLFVFQADKDITIKSIKFTSKEAKSFGVNDNFIYCVSNEGIDIYNKSGKKMKSLIADISNPLVRTAGEYAAIGEIDASMMYFYKNSKLVKKIKSDNNIINFSLNSDGHIVYLDEGKEYKTSFNLLDAKGNTIFNNGKGEKFIVDAKVAPDSTFAALNIIDTSGASANTNIEFLDINLNYGKVLSSTTKENIIYVTIIPYKEGIIAVGSSKLSYFTKLSSNKWTKEMNGKIQSACKISKNQVVVSANKSNNNMIDISESEISIFNIDGELENKFTVNGRAKNIKSYSDMILTYTSRDIYINDSDGDFMWKKSLKKDIIDAYFLYEDRIAIVDRDKIEILKVIY